VPEKPSFPPVKHATLILFASILFFTILGNVWSSVSDQWKMVFLESSVIIPVLIYVWIRRYPFRQVFRLRPVPAIVLIVSGLIGLGLSVVTEEINRLVQFILPMPDVLAEALEKTLVFHSVSEFLVLILGVVLVASFAEEMLFRGFFQGAVEQLTDVTRAVLISALIFTFIHFNPWWAVEILVLGVLLGVMTWRSDSIYPAVVVHGVNNALSVVMINTESSQLNWYQYKGHVSPVWLILSVVFIYFGFRLFYRLTDKGFDKKMHLNSIQSV
jgi:membrane protease YdiL (CAAX protease family)